MATLSLTVEAVLDSAHRLTCVPEGHKCRRLHGHSYTVEVTVEGSTATKSLIVETGVVVDAIMQFDHCFLNEKFVETGHEGRETTIEQIAMVIAIEVEKALPEDVGVATVYVREGFGASVVYTPGFGI